MYLIRVGDAVFAPNHVVRVFLPEGEEGDMVVRVLLTSGEPIAFAGAEAEAFLAYAAAGIHRIDQPPAVEAAGAKVVGVVVRSPGAESGNA